MKNLITFVMPVKMIAGGVLFGFIGFYMVFGILYSRFTGAEFEHSVPFTFIWQGAALAIAIAISWEVFFGDAVIKKWRFFKRALMFNLSLIILTTICFIVSFALPTDWDYLWFVGIVAITLGMAIISGLFEIYYRKAGEKYNEMLQIYKKKRPD